MEVSIDKDKCMGCGNCEALCPGIFAVQEGKAELNKDVDLAGHDRCLREAAEMCPSGAIKLDPGSLFNMEQG